MQNNNNQRKASFIFNSDQPNFTRDLFKTVEEMMGVEPNVDGGSKYTIQIIDDGHISFCVELNEHFKYVADKETSFLAAPFQKNGSWNYSKDPVTGEFGFGKWRLLKSVNDLTFISSHKNSKDVFTGSDIGGIKKDKPLADYDSQSVFNILDDILFSRTKLDYELPSTKLTLPEDSDFQSVLPVGCKLPTQDIFIRNCNRGSYSIPGKKEKGIYAGEPLSYDIYLWNIDLEKVKSYPIGEETIDNPGNYMIKCKLEFDKGSNIPMNNLGEVYDSIENPDTPPQWRKGNTLPENEIGPEFQVIYPIYIRNIIDGKEVWELPKLEKQDLSNNKRQLEIELPAINEIIDKQIFIVPGEITNIQMLFCGIYSDVILDTYNKEPFNNIIPGIMTTGIQYYKYSYSGPKRGNTKLKIYYHE